MSGTRVRLFVALELPTRLRTVLAEWGSTAAERHAMRALEPASLHVTLCFLGWCDAEQVEQISAACDLLSEERSAPLRLGEALWLPPRRPRVLAVALEDLDRRLELIQDRMAARLEAGGWYVREKRPFLAHVTVARARRGRPPKPQELGAPPGLSLTGERITLFRSTLNPGGARYEPLHTLRLVG